MKHRPQRRIHFKQPGVEQERERPKAIADALEAIPYQSFLLSSHGFDFLEAEGWVRLASAVSTCCISFLRVGANAGSASTLRQAVRLFSSQSIASARSVRA